VVRESLADPRTAWRGTVAGLLVGAVLVLVLLSGVLTGPFTALQDRLFPAPPPDPGITLVAVDQASGDSFLSTPTATAWPYRNDIHAAVIENLARLHPRVLVVDIVFDHSTGLQCEAENLGTDVGVGTDRAVSDEQRCNGVGGLVDTDQELVKALASSPVPILIACDSSEHPIEAFKEAVRKAPGGGMVVSRDLGLPDAANTIRSVPAGASSCGSPTESFPPAFAQAVASADGGTVARDGDALVAGRHRVPLTADGQMLIDFSSGVGSPTCTYNQAFTNQCPAKFVTGRIVVIGARLVNADDIHSQPVAFPHSAAFCPTGQARCMDDNANYGYRILADEIGTVLRGRYLATQPPLSIALAALLISALFGTVAYLLPFRAGLLATLIAGFGYVAAIVLLAQQLGWLADPLYAPLAILGSAGSALSARYLIEERERRKLEGIFGRYVDPKVLSELIALQSANELPMGGERREITVLFADVRGFTTSSEKMPAERVVALLNEFTERCTRIVFEHGGTVDKYIGDCVMAFWNAPAPVENHAERAVDAALHLLEEPGVSGDLGPVGIGVFTGEAVVGNVGGSGQVSYTAIGDTVNTASRLCSAAPARALLIGETTWRQLRQKPAGAERLEPLHVKGREEAVGVWSVSVAAPVASPV
jgi:class 3 adenylate cyclase/CHASE2 domain-containing sensor protein